MQVLRRTLPASIFREGPEDRLVICAMLYERDVT